MPHGGSQNVERQKCKTRNCLRKRQGNSFEPTRENKEPRGKEQIVSDPAVAAQGTEEQVDEGVTGQKCIRSTAYTGLAFSSV